MEKIAALLVFCSLTLMPAARADEATVTVKNGYVRLQFNLSNGGLRRFVEIKSGDDYLKSNTAVPPPFSLTIGNTDGSQLVEAYPTKADVSVQEDTVLVRTGSVQAGNETLAVIAEIKVQLAPKSAECYWTIRLENHAPTKTIFAVTLPRINGVQLGNTWEDDALYFPYWGGERFPHAVKDLAMIGERSLPGLEMGSPRVEKANGHYVHEIYYAGGASMMWMDYVDRQHGLYIASYDPEFRVTVLHADTPGPPSGSMNFELRKWVAVRPGQTWNSAPIVMAAHGADWHWAADQYRAWFHTQVPLTFHGGSWRERTGGWLAFMKNAYGRVKFKFSDLPQLWYQEKQAGMDLLIPYGWSIGGFDTYDPEYYPDLDLGGPMAMARAYQLIRQDAGHIMMYLNGRIFDMNSIYFKTLGMSGAAKKPDGSYIVETYKPGSPESFAVMCPGVDAWRNLLADFGEMAVRDYDVDLVYYDQVAAARPVQCLGPGQDGGLWNQNYVQLLRQVSAAAQKHNPEVAFMIEGAGDLYTPYSIFQSYLGPLYAGTRYAFPELYKYTFPEAIQASLILQTRASVDSLYPGFPAIPREVAERWLCREIMNGNLFAFIDALLDDPAWWEEVQQLLALRKAAAPWSGHGEFRDTVDVIRSEPNLEVKTFQWDQGKVKSTLVETLNETRTPNHRITINCGPLAQVRAYRLGPGGSKSVVPISYENGQATFEASAELLSMTVIEGTKAVN